MPEAQLDSKEQASDTDDELRRDSSVTKEVEEDAVHNKAPHVPGKHRFSRYVTISQNSQNIVLHVVQNRRTREA